MSNVSSVKFEATISLYGFNYLIMLSEDCLLSKHRQNAFFCFYIPKLKTKKIPDVFEK